MSSWRKPDPSDVLWPPERPPLQRPQGNWAVRGYAAWKKWERDEPLSPQDVLALGLSPDSPLLQLTQKPKARKAQSVSAHLRSLERRLWQVLERFVAGPH